MKQAASKVKRKVSAGLYQKGTYFEEVTIMDRFEADNAEGVVFPAVIPRRFIFSIFSEEMDIHRKVYESPDKKTVMLYCLAGREILVASLKPESRFKSVQEAYAALGFDPTPAYAKIKALADEVKALR